MLDKAKYISHLNNPEDEKTARRILDYVEGALKYKSVYSSDFLNPHEQKLASSLVSQFHDLHFRLDGGFEPSEQKIILIAPDFYNLEDYSDLQLIQGPWDGLFSHRDVLGSLLSLGIERKKIGDIFFSEDAFYFAVKNELADFLEFNLKKIRRNPSSLKKIDAAELIRPKIHYEVRELTVSSLRLDTIISEYFHLSRSQSSLLLKRELVKVNFCLETKPSVLLNQGDMVSVRRKGRFIFDGIIKKTKKERYRVRILYQK